MLQSCSICYFNYVALINFLQSVAKSIITNLDLVKPVDIDIIYRNQH